MSIPALTMPFPRRGASPAMDTVLEDMWAWLDRFGLPGTQAMHDQLTRTSPQLTTALYYPNADAAHLRLPARYMAWGFIVDDLLDDTNLAHDAQAAAAFIDELVGVAWGTCRPSRPAGHAFADVMADLCRDRTPGWRTALAEGNAAWLATYRVEAEDRDRQMSFGDYLPHRRSSVGETIFFHLHEYVAGIELPAQVRELPAMAQARDRGSEWIGLYNDLYSAGKEAVVDYPFNAVHLLRRLHGCSAQAAAGMVAAVLDGLMDQFEAACACAAAQVRAITDDRRVLADIEAVLDGYRCLLRGNFDYHPSTDRYSDVDAYAADGPTNGGAPWSATALTPGTTNNRTRHETKP
ncbi:terpene synthase family protein [Spirillospora sp. NPDC048911]|uniref:terpene synthase family protein n=1 Tax=Spirillospora sp. NPDC048911 TaxID=3364527 RepID=UPI0037104068